MPRPKEGDVFRLPLPDGTYGLAQYLSNDMVVVFSRRFEAAADPAEVLSTPAAFRVVLRPEYWRERRWTKLGRQKIAQANTTPVLGWSCRPDFTGHLWEWRHGRPAKEFGDVGLPKAVGAVSDSMSCAEAELWLFRILEGIPYDPWWGYERNGIAIPWALPRPEGYDYSWATTPQPDTLDAPARAKLIPPTPPSPGNAAPSNDDALVTWHGSAGSFVTELADAPPAEWSRQIEAALTLASRETHLTVDDCGDALAAAFLLGVAGGAELSLKGAPADALEQAPEKLTPAVRRKLAPLAASALGAILDPGNEMAALLSDAPDFESFKEQVNRLRRWFAAS